MYKMKIVWSNVSFYIPNYQIFPSIEWKTLLNFRLFVPYPSILICMPDSFVREVCNHPTMNSYHALHTCRSFQRLLLPIDPIPNHMFRALQNWMCWLIGLVHDAANLSHPSYLNVYFGYHPLKIDGGNEMNDANWNFFCLSIVLLQSCFFFVAVQLVNCLWCSLFLILFIFHQFRNDLESNMAASQSKQTDI